MWYTEDADQFGLLTLPHVILTPAPVLLLIIEALIGVPGNREHWPKSSREQGALDQKQLGTGNNRPKTARKREHKSKKWEQGTVQKQPGTGNNWPKAAGNREQ